MLAVATVPEAPVALATLLPWARLLEELGVAGFGWGVAWVDGDGLHRYRSVSGLRRDAVAETALCGAAGHRVVIHLRRPSLMASQSHVNAQPYLDETLGVAFAHNGYFRQHGRHRPEVADQLEGTSDSEVGFRLWTTALAAARPGAAALVETHRRLEGHANIMTVSAAGELLVYAGNPENRCYTFAAEGLKVAVTALHSADRYVFDAVFPQARAVTVIPLDTVASLA